MTASSAASCPIGSAWWASVVFMVPSSTGGDPRLEPGGVNMTQKAERPAPSRGIGALDRADLSDGAYRIRLRAALALGDLELHTLVLVERLVPISLDG